MSAEIIHEGRNPTENADPVPYLDAFRPPEIVPPDTLRRVGMDIVPPLLGALSNNGISVFVTHNLGSVAKIQKDSRGGMHLAKTNDPKFHPKTSWDDTNVLVLSCDSALVGCISSRLIWCERTLAEEMESGRFWVSDPATMWTSRDRCITNSVAAKAIRGCPVVYCGSVYLDPRVRGGVTLAAMCRLHLLWLVCHWRWSWLVGVVEGGLLHHHAFDVYGVDLVEHGLWITRDDDDELHRYQLALNRRDTAMEAWLRPEMGDLARPMGRPPKTVLPREAVERSRTAVA